MHSQDKPKAPSGQRRWLRALCAAIAAISIAATVVGVASSAEADPVTITIYPPGSEPPPNLPQPTDLRAGHSRAGVSLSWTDSSHDSTRYAPADGYNIYRGGDYVGTSETTSWVDPNGHTNASYYVVSFFRATSLYSPKSAITQVGFRPVFPPVDDSDGPPVTVIAPGPANFVGTAYSSSAIGISWDKIDSPYIVRYVVKRDGTTIYSSNGDGVWDDGLKPGTTYTYQLETVSTAGVVATLKIEVTTRG